MKSDLSVIIPAAGLSQRFRQSAGNAAGSKLFYHIKNEPLIVSVLKAFDSSAFVREIIIATEQAGEKLLKKEILSKNKFRKPVILVRGGNTRAESVWNALRKVSKNSQYVCVHDAARPLIKPNWISHMMNQMNGSDGLVLGRHAVPTVKVFDPDSGLIKQTLKRSELFEAETPQIVKKEIFLKAYLSLGPRAFKATDDVSLIEQIGGKVKAVVQDEPNIKVTTYQDLKLAKALAGEETNLRFGFGSDRHRLVPKRALYLGGLKIPSPLGSLGHSDGDVVLHSIVDGILGALGAGDIGDFFPNTPKWKNVRSGQFLKQALQLASQKNLMPFQVDVTIILERPKLGIYKQKIKSNLARLLSLPEDKVSIKAKTAEGMGPEGEGLALSAQALVVLGGAGS